MKRTFISYSRQNLVFAERLAHDLHDAGLDVWIDKRQIKVGEPWREAIFEGIRQSENIIICLSPAAIESEWVRREILMARIHAKLILPVMVEKCFDRMDAYDETRFLLDLQIIDFELNYEQAFPLLLQSIPGVQITTPDPHTDIDPTTIPNPFKGLEAFQETDAAYFFGREDLTAKLLDHLREEHRFLAVVGASGSGKSSLVRAGLIPAIRRGELPGSENWPIAVFTPGIRPTEALAKRLLPIIGGNRLLPEVVQVLESGFQTLHQVTEGVLSETSASTRLALVLDQFEEVFTRASQTEATRFLDLLHNAVTISEGRTQIILTMRADFFDRLSAYPAIATLFEERNLVIVTDMTTDNLRRSIESPAQAVGLVYDSGLPDRILEDVRQQPGSLPLLEYALKELYERRDGRRLTFDAYEQIGGVRRALAQHAEDIYNAMNTAQRDIMRRLLLRLVEVSETGEATRRKVERADLTFQDVTDNAVSDVINRLTAAESRLLITSRDVITTDGAEQSVWLEVSHEALIREWERFTDWITTDEESLKYGSDLLKAVEEWEKSGHNTDYLLTGSRLVQAESWLQSADANDLQREFIQASAIENRARLERERNQQRRLKLVQFGLMITLLMILGFALYLGYTESENAERFEAQAATANALAENAKRRAEESESARIASEAQRMYENGNVFLAYTLALDSIQDFDYPSTQAQYILADLAYDAGARTPLRGHTNKIFAIAFNPDGKTALSADIDNNLILWDLETWQKLRVFSGGVTSIEFSPDGQTVLSGTFDNKIILWDIDTGEIRQTLVGHQGRVTCTNFNSDGTKVVSGAEDASILIWDLNSGNILQTLREHENTITAVAFTADDEQIMSSSQDGLYVFWDVSTGNLLKSFSLREVSDEDQSLEMFIPETPTATLSLTLTATAIAWTATPSISVNFSASSWLPYNGTAFSPDGKMILSSSKDDTIQLWSSNSGAHLAKFSEHQDTITSVAFNQDGRLALTASLDGKIILWDVDTKEPIRIFSGHQTGVTNIAFSPDGNTALSGSMDGTLILWDLDTGAWLNKLWGDFGDITNISLSVNGQSALASALNASSFRDGKFILWQISTGEIQNFDTGNVDLTIAVISPDGQNVAYDTGPYDVADKPYRIILWNIGGEILHEFEGHTGLVKCVSFSPDGQTVLSGSADNTLILWNAISGERLLTFTGHSAAVNSVAFSPDGQTVLSGSDDNTLILWNAVSGERLLTFTGHSAAVNSVAFSPDGQTVLSGSDDNTLILWNAVSGERLLTFTGHSAAVNSVAFSPDRQTVLSGSDDNILILWDAVSGEQLRAFRGHQSPVTSLVFSPDGKTIISGSASPKSLIRRWRVDALDELVRWTQENRYTPELTCDERLIFRIEPYCDPEIEIGSPTSSATTSTPITIYVTPPTPTPTGTFTLTPLASPVATISPVETEEALLDTTRIPTADTAIPKIPTPTNGAKEDPESEITEPPTVTATPRPDRTD